jgi:DNA polymerase-1
LQNIPIRTELGRQIRGAFIPSQKGRVLLSADYSQIELRILAHLSMDEHLSQAFKNGDDIHQYTAGLMFDVPPKDVDAQMRYAAKRVNFGIIYGISAFGLAKDLNVPAKKAQEFIDRYFQRYPKVKKFMDDQIVLAHDLGFVTSLLGRRRYLPDIHSQNAMIRNFAQRQAINAPMQATAADMIKLAMVNIVRHIVRKGYQSRMILTVHDELVFDVPQDELLPMARLVKDGMENVINISVPIVASVKAGNNWLEMQPVNL